MNGGRTVTGMAILGLALSLMGCGVFRPVPDGQVPIDGLDVEPVPARAELPQGPIGGPVIELASGRVAGNAFQFTAYQGADGVCVELTYGNTGGGSCGGLPALGDGFGMVGSGDEADIPDGVYGVVSEHASSVTIETDAGPPATAFLLSLEPIGLEDQFFFAFLPVGTTPGAVVANGEDGSLIERLEFNGGHRPPANAPGATPAGDANSP